MHRIDTPTAQKDKFGAGKNGFTKGDPQTGTPATEIDETILDALQEEISAVIESAGIALQKTSNSQLLQAITFFLSKKINVDKVGSGQDQIPGMMLFRGSMLGNGYFQLPIIGAGGGSQNVIVQFGVHATAPGSNAAYNLNIAFPDTILWASGNRGAPGSNSSMNVSPEGKQQIRIQNWAQGGVPENCFWMAIGR